MLFTFNRLQSGFAYLGLLLFATALHAQERVLTLKELFALADKNSKSIQMHQLAVQEARQGTKVARNAYLPSLNVRAEASSPMAPGMIRTTLSVIMAAASSPPVRT